MFTVKILNDGVDFGIFNLRLSNFGKKIVWMKNKILGLLGALFFGLQPKVVEAGSALSKKVINLCPTPPNDNIYAHRTEPQSTELYYTTESGNSYSLMIVNTDAFWRQVFIEGEVKALKKEITEHDLPITPHKLKLALKNAKVSSSSQEFPYLDKVLSSIDHSLTLFQLTMLMAKEKMPLLINFSAFLQCAKETIAKSCRATLDSIPRGQYLPVAGLLSSPAANTTYMSNFCNISVISLLRNSQRDIEFENCLNTNLVSANTPLGIEFFNNMGFKTSIIGSVILLLLSAAWFSFSAKQLIQQVQENYQREQLDKKLVNPLQERLTTIKYKGDIPDEFICPITQMIMHKPVEAEDGKVYEEAGIKKWFLLSKSNKPPQYWGLDRKPHTKLIPKKELADKIEAFVKAKEAEARNEEKRDSQQIIKPKMS